MKNLILMALLLLPLTINANEATSEIYVFEVELSAFGETYGSINVTLASGYPVKLTSPSGHMIDISMEPVTIGEDVMTEIRASVLLMDQGEPDFVTLPRMFLKEPGDVSLSPQGDSGNANFQKLRLNVVEIIPSTPEDIEALKSVSRACPTDPSGETALDWGMDGGIAVFVGCCTLNCSGSGSWACCGAAATCCCNESTTCCNSYAAGIDP